jgi:hypothetical protein
VGYSNALNDLIKQLYPKHAEYTKSDQTRIETEGGSYDNLRALEKLIGQRKLEILKTKFKDESSKLNRRFLNPGVTETLEALRKNKIAHAIITAGTLEGQNFQLEISQLDHIPHLIIHRRDKGSIMAEEQWTQSDGLIRVPTELAVDGSDVYLYALLVDDKAVAFQDMPAGKFIDGLPRGFWGNYYIDPRYEQLPSQKGRIPNNVTAVRSLLDICIPDQSKAA